MLRAWLILLVLVCLSPALVHAGDAGGPAADPAGTAAPPEPESAPSTLILQNKSTCSVEVLVNDRLQGALPPGSVCRIGAAGAPLIDAPPAVASPTQPRWKSHGGWSTEQLPSLTLRAILPDGSVVQADQVVHGDAHGSALVWFDFGALPGPEPSADRIAAARPLPWSCAVPSTPLQIAASLSDASTDAALISALTDFYDHKGVWAGQYHLLDCISIAVGRVHDGISTAYVAYHYQPLQTGLPSGIDKRCFTLSNRDGTRTVTEMGEYQSAADGGCRLEAAGDPALEAPTTIARPHLEIRFGPRQVPNPAPAAPPPAPAKPDPSF